MRRRKITFLVVIILGILLLAVYCVIEGEKEDFFAKGFVGFLGICVACFELIESALVSKGQFVLELEQAYTNNPEFTDLFMRCWKDYIHPDKKTNINIKKDRNTIINYLTYFESIYIMINKGNIELKLIDDLFARRFFVVVNNAEIQKYELVRNKQYYNNIIELYEMWKNYREERVGKRKKTIKIKEEKGNQEDVLFCYNDKYRDLAKEAQLFTHPSQKTH